MSGGEGAEEAVDEARVPNLALGAGAGVEPATSVPVKGGDGGSALFATFPCGSGYPCGSGASKWGLRLGAGRCGLGLADMMALVKRDPHSRQKLESPGLETPHTEHATRGGGAATAASPI